MKVRCNIAQIILKSAQICDFIFLSVISSFVINNRKIKFCFCGRTLCGDKTWRSIDNANHHWNANRNSSISSTCSGQYWTGWRNQNLLLSNVHVCQFEFSIDQPWTHESQRSYFGFVLSNIVSAVWNGICCWYWSSLQYMLHNGFIVFDDFIAATFLLRSLHTHIQPCSPITVRKYHQQSPEFLFCFLWLAFNNFRFSFPIRFVWKIHGAANFWTVVNVKICWDL